MNRSLEHKEQNNHCWVPFRESDIVSSSRIEYGQISWNPAFIPHGRNILVDVAGLNSWLKSLNIEFPLEIKPYHPKNDDIQISGLDVNKNGEAALTGLASKSRIPKPKLSKFFGDLETNSQTIFVNFSGLAEYIKLKKPNIIEKDFNNEYGNMIDSALKSQAANLIFFNYFKTMTENPYMVVDFLSALGGIFIFIASETVGVATFAHGGKLNLESAMVLTSMSTVLSLLLHNGFAITAILSQIGKTNSKEELNKTLLELYSEYLSKRDSDFPWKLMFPLQFNRYFSTPLILSHQKSTLIKGRE